MQNNLAENNFLNPSIERREPVGSELPWALRPIDNEDDVPPFSLGPMDSMCFFCKALHFKGERPKDGNFSHCCNKGKVILTPAGDNFPSLLRDLFSGVHQHSVNFLNNSRQYNNALAFAAMGCKQAEIGRTAGPYVFVLHDQVYHRTFPMFPSNDRFQPVYNQLYVVDVEEARNHRMSLSHNDLCIPALMEALDVLLREINPLARACKQMREVVNEEREKALQEGRPVEEVSMAFFQDNHKDNRRYNINSSDQIAAVFKIVMEWFPVTWNILPTLLSLKMGKNRNEFMIQVPSASQWFIRCSFHMEPTVGTSISLW